MEVKQNVQHEKYNLKSLNGLRGIGACIIAFIWHYQWLSPVIEDSKFYTFWGGLYSYGWLAVEAFFMISGFSISLGYEKRIRNLEIDFRNFIYKRLCRLYPLFFITLIVVTTEELFIYKTLGCVHAFPTDNFTFTHFIMNTLLISTGIFNGANWWTFNLPMWCIPINIVLYSLYYLINSKMREKSHVMYIVFIVVGFVVYYNGYDFPFFNVQMARGLMSFFIGCILFDIYIYIYIYQSDSLKTGKNIISLVGTIALFLYFIGLGNLSPRDIQILFIFIIMPLIIYESLNLKIINAVLSTYPFQILGRISYSLYCWHFPIICAFKILEYKIGIGFDYFSLSFYLIYILIAMSISFISNLVSEKMTSLCIRIRSGEKT